MIFRSGMVLTRLALTISSAFVTKEFGKIPLNFYKLPNMSKVKWTGPMLVLTVALFERISTPPEPVLSPVYLPQLKAKISLRRAKVK